MTLSVPGVDVSEHSARAKRLIASSLVWDNHACMPLRPGDGAFLPQLQRAKAVGFTAVSLNIGFGTQTPDSHLRMLAWFRRWLAEHSSDYALAESVDDLSRLRAEGRLAVLFDIEGAGAIGDDLGLIRMYRDLGVRWMLIAYNRANRAGSGCYDATDEGLTPFGREVIAEMNRVGMTVCCSHTGLRTARDTLAASRAPVIFSHSNCAAVHSHTRNLSDALIRACADQGGVIGITGIGDFLCPPGADLVDALVTHVDHAVQLVGPDHVGLSLDYVYDQQELSDHLASMTDTFPDGVPPEIRLVAPEALTAIVQGLLGKGYGDADVRAILGESWARVAKSSWLGTTA